jgi:hypothetical protein
MSEQKPYYPHTFTKGHFAGQTFETRQDYWKALKATQASRKITRKPRKSKAVVTTTPQPSVRAIIRAYETLRSEGLGEAKASRIVEELILGR